VNRLLRLSLYAGMIALVLVSATTVAVAGTRSARTTASLRVPRVQGLRLDIAEAMLRLRGLRPVEHGGGYFGIVVKHNWQVCIQSPAAGRVVSAGSRVSVFVTRPGEC